NMLTGQQQPSTLAQAWHINPLEERVDSALSLTLREDDLAAGLVRMRPQDPGYDSLRAALVNYRALAAKGGWSAIPSGKPLKRGDGDSPARLAALRSRLAYEGYLTDSAAAPAPAADTTGAATPAPRPGRAVFDKQLAGAVANFQAHHGIVVDS